MYFALNDVMIREPAYVSTENRPHRRSVPPPPTGQRPPTGNPGSATGYVLINLYAPEVFSSCAFVQILTLHGELEPDNIWSRINAELNQMIPMQFHYLNR